MKNILVIFIFWMGCMLAVQAQQHPCVYVSPSDKVTVRQKVKNEPWAGEAFAAIRSKVEKYVDRHQTDPEWIISRLAMYWKEGERYTQCYLKKQNWDRGEGNAPVPTVRMPGMRTWNKYANVPLEQRIPYNETDKSNNGFRIILCTNHKQLITKMENSITIRNTDMTVLQNT